MAAVVSRYRHTGSWVVPPDVSTLTKAEVWGAGGGGGGAGLSNNAQGGGGGAYSREDNYSVTPSAVIEHTVGLGGAGNTGNGNGGVGGDSHIVNASTIMSKGGGGGTGNTNTTPGAAGGAAGSGVGTTKFSGGQGGGNSGGGGGSATSTANGGNGGDGPPSGAAGTGEGAGGAGGPNGGAGLPGTEPGGGGGGGDSSGGDGGDGARGEARYSFTTDYPVIGSYGRNGGLNSTAITITKPAGTVNGDLLVCHITSGSAGVTTPPADAVTWTEEYDTLYNVSGERHALYWKIAGGSEPADYTFTSGNTGGLSGHMVRIPAGTFNASNPLNVHAASDIASTTTPSSPSVTTTKANCMILLFLSAADNDPVLTRPTGCGYVSSITAAGGGAGSDIGAHLGFTYQATAGATGAKQWTSDISAPFHAITVAIEPNIVPIVVTVDKEDLQTAGQTVSHAILQAIAQASLQLAGQTVAAPQLVTVAKGDLRVTGQTIITTNPQNVIVASVTLGLDGQDLILPQQAAVVKGDLQLAGQVVGNPRDVIVAQGSLIITGQDVATVFPQVLVADHVGLVIAGQEVEAAIMGTDLEINVDQLMLNLIGQSVVQNHSWIGGTRRNLLTYSQDFENAIWVRSGSLIVTSDTDVAPDGTTTADTITDSNAAANGSFSQSKPITPGSNSYTGTLYIKKTVADPNYSLIQYAGAVGGVVTGISIVLDSNTGMASTVSQIAAGGTYVIHDAGDYWRLEMTIVPDSLNTLIILAFAPTWNTTGTLTGVVATTGSKVIWGAQVERNTQATEYQRMTSGVTSEWIAPLATLQLTGQALARGDGVGVFPPQLQLAGQSVLGSVVDIFDVAALQLSGQGLTLHLSVPISQAGLLLSMGDVGVVDSPILGVSPATLRLSGQTATFSLVVPFDDASMLMSGQSVPLDRPVPITPAQLRLLGQVLGNPQVALVQPATLRITGRLVIAGAELEPRFGRGNALFLTARGDAVLLTARGDAFLTTGRGDVFLPFPASELQ